MPECKFSETQFSFCYTFEFLQKYTPWSLLPFFPSTYIEGQPGYGYDVRVNQNLYFQFKRPFFVSRRRNPNFRQWDTYGRSYLRIHVDTDDEQFKLLKQLKTHQNEVLYVAPEFYKLDDLSLHYHNHEIVDNSLAVSISDLPAYGSSRHSLCYLAGGTNIILFSEPQKIYKLNIDQIVSSNRNTESNSTTLASESQRILSLLQEHKIPKPLFINQPENVNQQFNYVKNLLLSQFNILWLPIISENQSLSIHY